MIRKCHKGFLLLPSHSICYVSDFLIVEDEVCGLQTRLIDTRKHSSTAHTDVHAFISLGSSLVLQLSYWSLACCPGWLLQDRRVSEYPQLKEHESWQELRLEYVLLVHKSYKTLAPHKPSQFLPCLQLRPCLTSLVSRFSPVRVQRVDTCSGRRLS